MKNKPDLSIAIVCWQMARELPRTLWSLSRGFQQEVDDLEYEIIVVDNGSDTLPSSPEMDPKPVISRIESPSPSPVNAMNAAISQCSGSLIGAWIDGARLASPNLLRSVWEASQLHQNPVLAVPNYQIGPARQAISVGETYSAVVEDALLQQAGWPSPATDLFSISTPEAKSIEAPMLETNSLFLRATDWARLKGYDPVFAEAGGGAANPDLFRRATELPETQLIRLDGTATFHQVHGGTTTDGPEKAITALKQLARHYARVRGTPMRPIRELGWIFDTATGRLR